MSAVLYRLGHLMARLRWIVLAVWALVLAVIVSLAVVAGGGLQDDFSIPGTEAQEGLDTLSQRFDLLAGTAGQMVFVAPEGGDVRDYSDEIAAATGEVSELEDIAFAQNPLDPDMPGDISDDDRVAISSLQSDLGLGEIPESLREDIRAVAGDYSTDGLTVHVGGELFSATSVPLSPIELLGVVLALLVLGVTFRSARSAGIPIAMAILGVAVSMAAVLLAAGFIDISSTTPTLAVMLGLAVGIDYSLFIVSRHRAQLVQGTEVRESIARALGTSGTAVVFAGVTVMIALLGLFVVGIPFLTVMGVAAAAAVAVAVLAAITALPAVLSILGPRLTPAPGTRSARLANPDPGSGRPTMSQRWVALVTARPILTVLLVLIATVGLALPAKDLALGLPDAGSEPEGTELRETYDVVAEAFGPGYNTPLLVTADIINTTDPVGVVEDLAAGIEEMDHVESVGLATPNPTADLGIIQVIPEGGQTDDATTALVAEIRDAAAAFEDEYGISDVTVTGATAVAIDISQRLSESLLPFGLLVVGLSVILLMMVFRSVWVPLKAALGFVLSVLAAFGVTAMVFQYGWGNELLGITTLGPVISFMPIIVMGVLFGLAMDYEVFLVSRMREDYVHTGDAQRSIRTGFAGSARVVTAAALIMISVFLFFIPSGSFYIQPIALALAVGVTVDAFVVRMTLVPAVLALLGERAWRLPRFLDRLMPALDVEGATLEHRLEHEQFTAEHGASTVRAEAVTVAAGPDRAPARLDVTVRRGETLVLEGESTDVAAVLAVLTARRSPASGTLVVLGHPLPDEQSAVRARTHVVAGPDPLAQLEDLAVRDAGLLVAVPDATVLAGAPERIGRELTRLNDAGATVVIAAPSDRPAPPPAALPRPVVACTVTAASTSSSPVLEGALT